MAEFPHVKLMIESGVDQKNLPSELKSKIKVFNLHKARKTDSENSLASLAIAQELHDYLSSLDDDDPTPDPIVPAAEPIVPTSVEPIVPVVVEPVVIAPVEPVVIAPVEPVAVDPPAKKKRWIPMLGWVEVK